MVDEGKTGGRPLPRRPPVLGGRGSHRPAQKRPATAPLGVSGSARDLALSLSAVDLNLLFVLHIVLEERSVVRAAARLCVTPSAVSNALARTRAALGDALLVREGKRLVPTSRALQIQSMLAVGVRSLEAALRVPGAFEPERVSRRWTIAASDYAASVLLAPLASTLRERAPRCSIQVTTVEAALSGAALQLGTASLLIGRFAAPPEGCRVADLWSDEMVAIARLGHPLVRGQLTMEAITSLPHVLTPSRDGTIVRVDGVPTELSLDRGTDLLVPHLVLVPLVVSTTDHVATIPRRLAERLGAPLGLQVLDPPHAIDAMRVQAMWHGRTEDDPAEAFLRATVFEVVRDCTGAAGPKRHRGDGGMETQIPRLAASFGHLSVG